MGVCRMESPDLSAFGTISPWGVNSHQTCQSKTWKKPTDRGRVRCKPVKSLVHSYFCILSRKTWKITYIPVCKVFNINLCCFYHKVWDNRCGVDIGCLHDCDDGNCGFLVTWAYRPRQRAVVMTMSLANIDYYNQQWFALAFSDDEKMVFSQSMYWLSST